MKTKIANVLALMLISGAARANLIQTVVDNGTNGASSPASFINQNNGLTSTVAWSGTGHVNGPTDIGASMTASYTNFSPSEGNQFYAFEEQAWFTDVVTFNESPIDTAFNFTIAGNSTANNGWTVFVYLDGIPAQVKDTGSANFTVFRTANDGPGQYDLTIRLDATVNLFNLSDPPAAGANLSGTSDYNDTLTLDSVTLAPGQTMVGQSGINYADLGNSAVPEPGTLTLLLTGLAGLVRATRRVRR